MKKSFPLWRRILRSILLALLAAVLLCIFYIAVIMGNPQEDQSAAIAARQDQPLLSAMSSPLLITDASQLSLLLREFPAPALAAMPSSVLTFEQGLCQDVPFENGLGRMVTLTYRTAEDKAVTVISIYPARGLSLLPKADFSISGNAGLPLAGLRSVRMENRKAIRMHAQGSEALYAVTLPEMSSGALRTITSTFQLYQGE